MSDDSQHTGSCLRGGVRCEIHGPLRDVVAYHCSQYRKTSGHIVAMTSVPMRSPMRCRGSRRASGARAARISGLVRCVALLLESSVDLFPVHGDGSRCFDTDADLIAMNGEHRHDDVIRDAQCLADPTGEDEHRAYPLKLRIKHTTGMRLAGDLPGQIASLGTQRIVKNSRRSASSSP